MIEEQANNIRLDSGLKKIKSDFISYYFWFVSFALFIGFIAQNFQQILMFFKTYPLIISQFYPNSSMSFLSGLPFTLTKQTPKKVQNILMGHSPTQLAVFHSKFIQLPISKNHSNDAHQYFSQETFPYINQWQIQELRCTKKLYPLLLLQISHILFEKLTFLHLSTCYIESIEALSWLNAPNLQQLSLDDNDILSIKPLQKTNFNRLQFLSCSDNFFLHDQIQVLNRMKLGAEKISHVKLSKIGKKKTNFIEGLLKIEAGCKINASIIYTEFNSGKKFQQIKSRFPVSLTSMVEGEVWMPEQHQYLKNQLIQSEEEEDQDSYFPFINN